MLVSQPSKELFSLNAANHLYHINKSISILKIEIILLYVEIIFLFMIVTIKQLEVVEINFLMHQTMKQLMFLILHTNFFLYI